MSDFPCQICSHLGLQEDNNTYGYSHELVDLIEVIRIKVVALYTEVSFNRFGKELPLSAFLLATLSS